MSDLRLLLCLVFTLPDFFFLAFVRKACTNNALLFPNTVKFSPLLPVFVACL